MWNTHTTMLEDNRTRKTMNFVEVESAGTTKECRRVSSQTNRVDESILDLPAGPECKEVEVQILK
ncbi:MAG: hypothetical protein J07HQW1_03163 [Haloquadratum walsbyi J07HQW1]|uniref:Uncharacterized protein n=1 Tax=Haloquadratum walsbyi J07HQW1 TaxID=1238424 RepID=U1PLJ7_9EURY|nr:MAG: hypothetical protein J07HQW1_03163 [Haloquadratum walsbyi J07HQW1]